MKTVPSEIGWLDRLVDLLLDSKEKITGTLPTLIGRLQNLEQLKIDSNKVNGKLPTELFLLTKLQVSGIESNHFTGTLPTVRVWGS